MHVPIKKIDLCDACYDSFKNGNLLHANARRNPISMKITDHEFYALAEPGAFKGMMGPAKTDAKKKVKPNAPCPCGSGKKYKKCCGKK